MSPETKRGNPYQSPKASNPCSVKPSTKPALTWWEARRMHYNVALLFAGVLAFICYVVVCCTLLPWVLEASKIKANLFTTIFQGVGYLFMMGVANVCYFLGPLSESVFQPSNVERYRRVCYQVGFWFSVLFPFGIPALLTVLVIFFPECWQR
jgi:hypothetical protein